jgi:ketosteroid isomerase-like protein
MFKMLKMLALAAIAVGAYQQATAAAAQGQEERLTDQAQLKRLNETWLRSYEQRDRAALGSVLAEDFVGIYGNSVLSKAQMLDGVATRPSTRVHWENLQIGINGNTAVVSATSTITITQDGKESRTRYNYADVYALRDNGWQAIAAHAVKLAD